VQADVETIRAYPSPYGVNAAHVLGYLGPVNDAELKAQALRLILPEAKLQRTDLVGRAGLEYQYDTLLRGFPGVRKVNVNRSGIVTGTVSETAATPGDYLVTNIDARLQAVVEQQLLAAIYRARSQTETNGTPLRADSGAAVVLDVRTGAVLAMASYPTYDPSIWVGGITNAELKQLLNPINGEPLISRAMQGGYPPGSTFKLSSAAAGLRTGVGPSNLIPCPPALQIGNRAFKNFESESYGAITLSRAIEVSCDTVFYRIAYDNWLRDGGNHPIAEPKDALINMALAFGFGSRTGIDLPSEASGRIETRQLLTDTYKNMKDVYCSRAKSGYPEVAKTDPTRAAYLKAIASDNCANGALYRGGDAVNFAIGQGGTLATPLQLAVAYAAIANGGTIYAPQVGKGALKPDGSTVAIFAPKVVGHLPLSQQIAYLDSAFQGVVTNGTASGVFVGFPLGTIPVAGKTGTAQMPGKMQPTSWFASFAPVNNPEYAVVMMVSQGNTGAGTSAPSVRSIYEAIYGITGSTINPKAAIFPLGHPPVGLPVITRSGVAEISPGANPTGPAAASPSAGLIAVPFLGLLGLISRRKRKRIVRR
jgi:penicillin-binding protein 2